MSIKTTEQLINALSNDLAWRKKELSEMKSLVEARSVSDQRHRALVRSGVCILYSHWEGFVKLAANSYLEYIKSKDLTYKELSSNFLALAMKEKLKEAKDTNKPSLYMPVCDFFLSELDQKCFLLKNAKIPTKNLSSEILKEITDILGIDFSPYSTKSMLINMLRQQRNNIAHGHYLIIDREEYIELHIKVIEMLNIFRNQIENAAVGERFRQN
jgi:hypothetical protein